MRAITRTRPTRNQLNHGVQTNQLRQLPVRTAALRIGHGLRVPDGPYSTRTEPGAQGDRPARACILATSRNSEHAPAFALTERPYTLQQHGGMPPSSPTYTQQERRMRFLTCRFQITPVPGGPTRQVSTCSLQCSNACAPNAICAARNTATTYDQCALLVIPNLLTKRTGKPVNSMNVYISTPTGTMPRRIAYTA